MFNNDCDYNKDMQWYNTGYRLYTDALKFRHRLTVYVPLFKLICWVNVKVNFLKRLFIAFPSCSL